MCHPIAIRGRTFVKLPKWQVLSRFVHGALKTSGSPWHLNGSDEKLQVIQYLRMDEDLFVQSHAQKMQKMMVQVSSTLGFAEQFFSFTNFLVDFCIFFSPWVFNTMHPS